MGVGLVKIIASIFIANIIRLMKFIPNNDPIMAMMLPFSKQEKWYIALAFPIITMVSFDIITGLVGMWTLLTSITYGVLGCIFYTYYKKRARHKKKVGIKIYFFSGILGVLIFDFITGVIGMPLLFGYTFESALVGQIPFTLMHLATVAGYTIIITPLLDKHILENIKLNDHNVALFFKKKLFARS